VATDISEKDNNKYFTKLHRFFSKVNEKSSVK
jgi:hypothetical protein